MSSGRIKNFVPNPDCCIVTSAHGAERKCWRVSLLAVIRGNAENICSPRVLLTVTHSGHSKRASGASGTGGGCVKMQMRDRRMVGQLAVSGSRISTDLLRGKF